VLTEKALVIGLTCSQEINPMRLSGRTRAESRDDFRSSVADELVSPRSDGGGGGGGADGGLVSSSTVAPLN
jgi:hypothetical protein